MTFRKIDPRVIVRSKIMAVQSGLGEETGITTKALEAHYMAGGKVPLVIRAIIAANKAKMIILDYKLATRSTWPAATCSKPCKRASIPR